VVMPLPRVVARFNKYVTNPLLGPITRFLPRFGTITHRGRTTGQVHRTPIMAFRRPDGRQLVFALTYGRETDWIKNFKANGRAEFDSRWSGRLALSQPRFTRDPKEGTVPWLIRRVLRTTGTHDFLEATIED
jgi:deazaflavin-dependent oxidoreductase (nitroreductase family)